MSAKTSGYIQMSFAFQPWLKCYENFVKIQKKGAFCSRLEYDKKVE